MKWVDMFLVNIFFKLKKLRTVLYNPYVLY